MLARPEFFFITVITGGERKSRRCTVRLGIGKDGNDEHRLISKLC
jgi:hypothetical protein